MSGKVGAKLGAMLQATLAIGLAACSGDSGDETRAPRAANATTVPTAATGTPATSAPDLDRFLMREGEEPGFRPDGQAETLTGVDAFASDLHLPPADARRLRGEGFISFTVVPTRGPRSAGLTNVALFETAEGARQDMAHELRADVIRAAGPVVDLRRFPVPGIPGARGWTASLRGEPASHDVANVLWVQGRCMLLLGNQGPGPAAGRLSTGARAIYERTKGECPS